MLGNLAKVLLELCMWKLPTSHPQYDSLFIVVNGPHIRLLQLQAHADALVSESTRNTDIIESTALLTASSSSMMTSQSLPCHCRGTTSSKSNEVLDKPYLDVDITQQAKSCIHFLNFQPHLSKNLSFILLSYFCVSLKT